jgi:Zinc binding domain
MSPLCECPPGAGAETYDTNTTSTDAPCPTNQQVGKAIDSLTLKALLGLPLTQLRPVAYRFCRAPNCPTVYYSLDGMQLFNEDNLREKVYQKHPAEDDILICYCFQHTLESIRQEFSRTGKSTVVEQISAGIRAGQCACDIRNPQGSCCLGNVQVLVRQLEDEIKSSGKLDL